MHCGKLGNIIIPKRRGLGNSFGVLLFATGLFGQGQGPTPCLSRPAAEEAYGRGQLVAMISEQGPFRAESLIRTCGVSVAFTAELEAELRKAGAQASVIRAVRDGAPGQEGEAAGRPKHSKQLTAGRVVINSRDGLPYVYIPPGRFRMGCSELDAECFKEESRAHNVTITRGFWMGQTEVIVEAYKRFTMAVGRAMPPEPVYLDTRKLNQGWNNEGSR